MLHKNNNQDKHIEFKEEQRKFLCSNKDLDRCSSLDINSYDKALEDSINALAEILVEAYFERKLRERKQLTKK